MGSYWVNLTLQLPIFIFLFPGPDFVGFFICSNIYTLVNVRLDELEGFSVGLERYVIELSNFRAREQHLEKLPRSDWSHIDHREE